MQKFRESSAGAAAAGAAAAAADAVCLLIVSSTARAVPVSRLILHPPEQCGELQVFLWS